VVAALDLKRDRFLQTAWRSSLTVLLTVAAQSQPRTLKTFSDAQHGVTFRYPDNWESGTAVVFYLGSEIVYQKPEGGPEEPFGKVGLVVGKSGPYAGTNLNGVQFVFNVVPGLDAASCRKRVEDAANTPVNQTVIHGVTYNHYSGGDAGLGHQASRAIYSTLRGSDCYLFEKTIHTFTFDEPRGLTKPQWKQLRAELDRVMESVRFEEKH
jgi:hypothetical protein